ncbi:MAG: AAA family ATPase [Solirubrobacteraceae bacterium]
MRRCIDCNHHAAPRARFCEQCGAALTPTATPLRAPSRIEAKILQQRTGIEGEHKQVTVMYTDVVGSMALTHALDAERWGLVLDRFLSIAAGAVHAFEGTVNQFTGDGLLAVFGAPLAHEDHARRACLAVLELQREVAVLAAEVARSDGVEFAVRCGLNSGEVVVGAIGDDVHMDFVPIGNTTALGKRIESLAPEGSTAVSASTAALVAGEFALRDLGEFEVKGVQGRQRALELVGPGAAQTRLEAVAATRGLSPFTGRDAESARLRSALARVLEGDGRAIGVVGDPGVGKSRLVHEFTADCAARGLAVTTTRGVSHGRYVPFLPVLALFRDFFEIAEGDAPKMARERIEGTLLALDPAFAEDLSLVLEFLGVADPGRPPVALDVVAHRRRLLAVATRALTLRGHGEASVLVIEDLHWLDDASDAFLEELVEAVGGTRTLLVATYRPEYEAAWATSDPHAQVALGPLDADATDDLLTGLLGRDRSLAGLAALIEARTAGNPFFLEEIVQTLVEDGLVTGARGDHRLTTELDGLVLPATVQAGLAARIDRLPAREKALVQTMSVIGAEVPGPLLTAVCGLQERQLADALAVLTGAQWVVPRETAGGREYVFKHPLTQEVAYGSQLSDRRAGAHRTVAAAIERTYPDGLDERAALVAHHCEAAGDALAAAGWHARAAVWAQLPSPAEGMRHWRRVRRLADQLDAGPPRDELAARARLGILSLAWRLGVSPEETAQIHADVRADVAPFPADLYHAGGLMHGGHEREGLRAFRSAYRAAVASGEPGRIITAATGVAYASWVAGSSVGARQTLQQALRLAGTDPATGAGLAFLCPVAHAFGDLGTCRGYAGDLAAARRDLDRCIALASAREDPETASAGHSRRALLEAEIGDFAAARHSADLGLAIAERAGNAVHMIACAVPVAVADAGAGRFAVALAGAESTLETIRRRRIGLYYEPLLLATIARCKLALGEPDGALAAAEEGVAITNARGLTTCGLSAPITLAHVLIAVRGAAAGDRIEAVLARAAQVARTSNARVFEPRIHVGLAALARVRGDAATAERERAEADRIEAAMRLAAPRC